ncbi:hypothetical protein MSG28_001203 [Choristoneura fumiferana]|uniref:Uncharacterized protein n=1 Tax=Choristoneura fumiferana TaxID=7141 RepID=A0ACC0K469_CHOFU|nr:hypothetical protein MSG28_001203 [Choristoneura fumiferana]
MFVCFLFFGFVFGFSETTDSRHFGQGQLGGFPKWRMAGIKRGDHAKFWPQKENRLNNRSRAFTISGNSNGPVNAMVGSGVGPNSCANDWLLVPCASNVGRVQPAQALCTDRICGGTFSAELSMQASSVMSTVKPFRLWFHTDNVEAPLDIGNRGFCLNYIQQPCTNNVM